ncbi:uncharacterized protein LOC113209232 isoform X2 [Frankliniella occidentalis]|uniref:Uncharacterized protein LOC113209232 isoform X2 n=1 Tax=Frankliniella occidentalis TaxID=133901 RepID=A0A9C6TTW5_FRAOC|nr:uncharacterized protein LOC113209232 isoform X2 [Frankliniella occidentalis]
MSTANLSTLLRRASTALQQKADLDNRASTASNKGGSAYATGGKQGRYIAYGTKFYNCDQSQLPTSDKPTWNWYLRFTHHFNPLKPEELQRFDGNVTGLERLDDSGWASCVDCASFKCVFMAEFWLLDIVNWHPQTTIIKLNDGVTTHQGASR